MSTPVKAEPVVLDAYIVDPPRAPADMTDRELATAAAKAVDDSLSMRAGSIEAALRAGELLNEARRRCDDSDKGAWSRWLGLHWSKSRTTAKRYMALASEAEVALCSSGLPGPRADRRAALLALPSVRAALTDAGYDAGGTRDEPEGMRSPGDDEGEEIDNTPTGDLSGPTPAEAAVVGRLAAGVASDKQKAEDAKRARRNKHRDGRDNPPAEQPSEADRAAERERQRLAAEKVAEERAALERAFVKPNGMEFPAPPVDPDAPPPEALVSIEAKAKALAEALHDVARRIGLIASGLGALKHAPIEGLDFLATGKDDPRRVELASIIAGLRPLFDGVSAIETYAPKLSAHGDYDARLVLAEQQRIAEQEQDDRAAVDMFSRKRGA